MDILYIYNTRQYVMGATAPSQQAVMFKLPNYTIYTITIHTKFEDVPSHRRLFARQGVGEDEMCAVLC